MSDMTPERLEEIRSAVRMKTVLYWTEGDCCLSHIDALTATNAVLIGTNAGLSDLAQQYLETIDSLRAELVTARQECTDVRSQMKDN